MGLDLGYLVARRLAKDEEWLRIGMGGLKNKEMISEREGSAAGLALGFQAHATLWILPSTISPEHSMRWYRSLRRQNGLKKDKNPIAEYTTYAQLLKARNKSVDASEK